MSGGTLIALAADEIIMSDHAVLGPVDAPPGQCPVVSLLKTVEEKSKDKVDQTLIMADQAKKAIAQARATVRELPAGKYPDRSLTLAIMLPEGKWTHDFPITFDFAKQLGLHVDSDVPPEVFEIDDTLPNRRGITAPLNTFRGGCGTKNRVGESERIA